MNTKDNHGFGFDYHYQRTVNDSLLYFLMILCENFTEDKKDYYYNDITQLVRIRYNKSPTDYSTLKQFGLISGSAGNYRPTLKGFEFITNRISIPKYWYGGQDFSTEQIYASDIIINSPYSSWKLKPFSNDNNENGNDKPVIENKTTDNINDNVNNNHVVDLIDKIEYEQ